MTTLGIEYQKLKESQRHNIATENLGQQEVDVKKYTASFEPRRVAAQELSAAAQKQNADTNTYVASFKPREVAATELQAQSSYLGATAAVKNAETNRLNYELNTLQYELDKYVRNAELTMKQIYNMEDINVRKAANALNRTSINVNKAIQDEKNRISKEQNRISQYKNAGMVGKILSGAEAIESDSTSWDSQIVSGLYSILDLVGHIL